MFENIFSSIIGSGIVFVLFWLFSKLSLRIKGSQGQVCMKRKLDDGTYLFTYLLWNTTEYYISLDCPGQNPLTVNVPENCKICSAEAKQIEKKTPKPLKIFENKLRITEIMPKSMIVLDVLYKKENDDDEDVFLTNFPETWAFTKCREIDISWHYKKWFLMLGLFTFLFLLPFLISFVLHNIFGVAFSREFLSGLTALFFVCIFLSVIYCGLLFGGSLFGFYVPMAVHKYYKTKFLKFEIADAANTPPPVSVQDDFGGVQESDLR